MIRPRALSLNAAQSQGSVGWTASRLRTRSNTSCRASSAHSLTQTTAPAAVTNVAAMSLPGDVCSVVNSCAAAALCGGCRRCRRCCWACRRRACLASRDSCRRGRLCHRGWPRREGDGLLTRPRPRLSMFAALTATVSFAAAVYRPPCVRMREFKSVRDTGPCCDNGLLPGAGALACALQRRECEERFRMHGTPFPPQRAQRATRFKFVSTAAVGQI